MQPLRVAGEALRSSETLTDLRRNSSVSARLQAPAVFPLWLPAGPVADERAA